MSNEFHETCREIAEQAFEDAQDAGEYASVAAFREYAYESVFEQSSSAHVYHSQAIGAIDEIAGDSNLWDHADERTQLDHAEDLLDAIHTFVAHACERRSQELLDGLIDDHQDEIESSIH
jgi:hypothetical protein